MNYHGSESPLVSVLMITYNHEQYIGSAIESVLSQETDFSFELVIGEDCSTDGTGHIVGAYAERFPNIIRVVTSNRNVGATKNARRVKAAASGKYFAWCEGDDRWKVTHKLQKQIDIISTNDDIGLVYSDHDRFYTETGAIECNYLRSTGRPPSTSPDVIDILSGRAGILTCTVVARAALVNAIIEADEYLFSSGKFLMGDTQLWAELALVSKIHYVDEAMSVRNMLAESTSRSRDLVRNLKFAISNRDLCVYLCEKHQLPQELKSHHEERLRSLSLFLAFVQGDPARSKEILQHGFVRWQDIVLHLGAKYRAIREPLLRLKRIRNALQERRW